MSDPHSPHDPTAARADRAAEVAEAGQADVALEGESKVDAAAGARVVAPEPAGDENRWRRAFREIATGNAIISVLAVILALIVGAIMIAATDETVQAAAGYFFARPGDTLSAIWQSVSGAYSSFFQGAIYNFRRPEFATGIRPLTETLTFATPLIAAGLGVALAFRVGMFNIGGRGQMLVAAAAGGWVAFAFDLPWGIHMIVALVAGVVAGAVWAGIAGVLKARTGAHEVIVTIMLNYVAFYIVYYLLRTPGLLQAPGSNNPTTPPMKDTAVFPDLFGRVQPALRFRALARRRRGGVVDPRALVARFPLPGRWPQPQRRARGRHQRQVDVRVRHAHLGRARRPRWRRPGARHGDHGFSSGIDAGIGFDAITVALLGRSTPVGVLVAGILFGAFKAGGFAMQAANGVPVDIVLVVQSLIVLFIAAPPLVRAIFRLPAPGARQPKVRAAKKKEAAR